MRIYSMTATFGKLEHQTLKLEPGLNIIEAPNEWGKSTWCAFLAAMLYGIDTRLHSTKTTLADKDRYAPWSGSPMAGSMDICWQGRDITIQRSTRGRAVFGDFKAYETASGLPVAELTATNCGQMLLGVERSVFLRAGFLRLNDLPVTQDEALLRRLNALVTTGDEGRDAERLTQKLRELKNRIRFNRTGLLPQAEALEADLGEKLRQLQALGAQAQQIRERLELLARHEAALENHLDALRYAAAQESQRRTAAADAAAAKAKDALDRAREACRALPSRQTAARELQSLQGLRRQLLSIQARPIAQAPLPPDGPEAFRGLSGAQADAQAQRDAALLRRVRSPLPCLLLSLPGLAALVYGGFLASAGRELWWAFLLGGTACLILCAAWGMLRRSRAHALYRKYGSRDPRHWLSDARQYGHARAEYEAAVRSRQAQEAEAGASRQALEEQLRLATGGKPTEACLDYWQQCLDAHDELDRRQAEFDMAYSHAQALRAAFIPASPPSAPDTLSFSQEDTLRMLGDIRREQHDLQLRLGHVMGRMEQLGSREVLVRELDTVRRRIASLEDTYSALVLAQQTLADAQAELQRRFAPRITAQARDLFRTLTEGRYDRLTLDQAMNLQAAASGEDAVRQILWRSDGTVDQLYLALRLAVARELTPHAPLVLDDALVRFDDRRLRAVMQVLRQEAGQKQVILFTCQRRERSMLNDA